MKIFFYKSVFIILLIYILFEITIGSQVRKIEKKFESYFSKEQFEILKIRINKEIDNLQKKEKILDVEDAKKIRIIIDKLKNELKY